mmetsp:Transcript_35662/g.54852  ORF Transcript_35662/g.54852 Transcript_35662/m.54852 type:complete len:290 (-) Transcript_35662:380-1249(-)
MGRLNQFRCEHLPKYDIILHVTGGGFFAHTIASDLPFLTDWSRATKSIIICPEYDLLPEHRFPDALNQIHQIYSSLESGECGALLGFQPQRIVVTGESAGGNLAAALCIKLGVAQRKAGHHRNEEEPPAASSDDANADDIAPRLPDALMLCCPALNLSLELSPSRVVGTSDPVLPRGLLSAISDAYILPDISKKHPLVSPYFAPDEVLRLFPPTLLFAGSNDPLLDDSVDFNIRLQRNGIQSELRVSHNLPHAYWGLGTAGFPEARHAQEECQQWLKRQLVTCEEDERI